MLNTTMANAEHGVFIEICQQHLEEAAFLYGQKQALSTDPDIPWTALDDWEQRIEAHIDGLVVGGAPALALCEQQAETGDPGELFATLCVGCRHQNSDLVDKLIINLDFTDTERVEAATAALKYALPAQWINVWRQQLPTAPPELAALKAEVLGYRHIPAQTELLQALPKTPAPFLPAIIRALGRLNDSTVRDALYPYLQHHDPVIHAATLHALLRLGERRALEYAASDPHHPIPLGLCGNQSSTPLLLACAKDGAASADGLVALGLLGDPAAVDTLFDYLSTEHAPAAVLGLQLMLGMPMNPGDDPDDIQELWHQPEYWPPWRDSYRSRLQAGVRYRVGQPCTPQGLLAALLDEYTPHRVRQLTAEELVIRYALDWPFATDWPVVQQRQLLQQTRQQFAEQAGAFQSGVWYFGARIISESVIASTVAPPYRRTKTAERHTTVSDQPLLNAATLWNLRDKGLQRHRFTLEQLIDFDKLLAARLEELYAAGGASWAFCQSELEQHVAGSVFVATLVALNHEQNDNLQQVFRIGCTTSAGFRELTSALGWLPYQHIAAWVTQLLASRFAINRRMGLAVCTVHRYDPVDVLVAGLDDPDPHTKACALRLAGQLMRHDLAERVATQLTASESDIRFWAAWSTTLLKHPAGTDVLRTFIEADSPFRQRALDLYLRQIPVEDAVAWLRTLSARPEQALTLAEGIGVLGLSHGIPWLLTKMRSPELAEAAGRAFLSITGASLTLGDQQSTLSRIQNAAPSPHAAEHWWRLHQERFTSGVRYLEGQPLTAEHCRTVLLHGQHRHAAALEQALLDQQQPLFEVRAPGPRQRRLLAAAQ